MSKYFVFLVIVLNLLSGSFADVAPNDTNKSNSNKSDTESSSKAVTESKRDKEKFAASLSELESARTHNSWRPSSSAGHGQRVLPFQFGQATHLPMNHLPPIAQLPLVKPILSHFRPHPEPVAPFKPSIPILPPVYSPPVHSPPVYSPPVYSPPVYSPPIHTQPVKPSPPIVEKPTFLVSQQVIHVPVVTEKIEIIRRPVISEVVEVVHKPVISEVQKVLKHPTYVEHILKKPVVHAVQNVIQGEPLHLPGQHYELHDKPQIFQPTAEVVQIPHQQIPAHGSIGYGPSYGFESGYKPGYGIESGFKPSYSGYKPSFAGIKPSFSGIKPSYSGVSGLTPTYGIGYGNIGLGSSQGSLDSGYGSDYGATFGYGSNYGNYGATSGYGDESGGVEQTWVVPAAGCKSGECNEEALYPTYENSQSMNSPYLWPYPSPSRPESRDIYGRNSGDEVYDQGIPLPPEYYYLSPQMTPGPDDQNPVDEQQYLKVNDFLTKDSTKPLLDALHQKFLETYANSHADDGKLTTQSARGRSNEEDTKTGSEEDKVKRKMKKDERVSQVEEAIKESDGATLKEIENRVREREAELARSVTTTSTEANKV